jgi:HD-GYP domain-containing protein (c-di-GMP phosphodiesterase class II)
MIFESTTNDTASDGVSHHQDVLMGLNSKSPLNTRLELIHNDVKRRYEFIARIAVALYDSPSALLKTFISSSGEDFPMVRYESPLAEAPSLIAILADGEPRVANDLSIFDAGTHEHTKLIRQQGYESSYTVPMYLNDVFWGFVFFNSYQKNCFGQEALCELDLYSHLITALVANEVRTIRMMLAALKTANDIVHQRDPETGAHLDRMSRYSRLIAKQLSADGRYHFDDEYIERIFLFSPLHDVGKIGIPDLVLLKPARLDAREFDVMKTHTTKGRQIIDSMMQNFGLESLEFLDVLGHIAEYHHEKINGTGYPCGLKGEQIPPEARIVAVADVFDALTSERPYKPAWSNADAFEELRRISNAELDSECVEALLKNEDKIRLIQGEFRDAVRTPE